MNSFIRVIVTTFFLVLHVHSNVTLITDFMYSDIEHIFICIIYLHLRLILNEVRVLKFES